VPAIHADRELPPQGVGEQDTDRCRHDQEGKHQEHPGKRHRAGHDHAEAGVEHELGEPRSALRQPRPEDPVQRADREIERDDGSELARAGGEDIAGENLLEVFRALRRTVDEQDRRRRGDHVDDADQRLLRNTLRPGGRERKEECGKKCEGERIEMGCAPLHRMTEHEGHGRAERGDLRQGQIDEDDVSRQHLDAEIGVDADQAQRHEKWRPQQCECIDHGLCAASRAPTLLSNNER
jgi:hypothetical protein